MNWIVPWGLNFCLQISRPLSGLACRLFRIRKSDPPSKILYRFLTVRFAQCLSFGICHSFELIATERIAKVVPFRMETRAWPEVTWGQLRTVPTNGEYFFPDNDYVRQVDHISGYWNPKRKLGVTTHFSEITALQDGEKRWIGIFKKNDKNLFFPQISERTRELAQMQW